MKPGREFARKTPIPGAVPGKCRGCGGDVPKGRRTWCGKDACVTDALIRSGDTKTIRREVKKRDREVCEGCGLDCGIAERVLARFPVWQWLGHRGGLPRSISDAEWQIITETKAILWNLWTGRPWPPISLWQADHIVPVVEGGGGCGLDGYRTLCCICHKAETAALAKRRSKAAKEAKYAKRLDL